MSAGEFVDRVVEATTYLPCPAWGKNGQPGGSCQLTCRNGHPFIVHGRGEGRCPACGEFAGYRAEHHLCAAQAQDDVRIEADGGRA